MRNDNKDVESLELIKEKYMELHEAIKTIIDTFGEDIITEKRFLNAITDYHSFRDNLAGKTVLTALVSGGYLSRFLGKPSGNELSLIISQVVTDVYNNYGFRKELIDNIVNSVVKGLGLEIPKENQQKIFSAFQPVTETEDSNSANIKQESSPLIYQTNGKELPYTEEYIMSLYPILFKYTPHHAHMDFDVFQKKLKMESGEAFKLFKFLKGMGVYKFNVSSDDYDKMVDSEAALRELYRSYRVQYSISDIPLPGGLSIKREWLSNIIKRLYKYKHVYIEEISFDFSLIDNGDKLAREVYALLLRQNVIDDNGRCLNPYLTPESMLNSIITKIIYP